MRRRRILVLLCALLVPYTPWPAQAQAVRMQERPVENGQEIGDLAARTCGGEPEVVARKRDGLSFRLRRSGDGVRLIPLETCMEPELPADPERLPDGVVSRGAGEIAWAWLAGPTGRYDHGILGDAIEAEAVRVLTRGGERRTFRLDTDSVFEDRHARIVDLDGDGKPEVLAIRSYLARGASLTLLGLRKQKLELLAQSEPIGRSHRWLNIVGVADFDGDGHREVAVVLTPHIGGTLALYVWRGGKLVQERTAFGFSNHAIGSREQGMSAVLDADGDGVSELVVPGAARSSLRIVTFAGGRFRVLGTVNLPGRIVTGLHPVQAPAGGAPARGSILVYGLEDGGLRSLVLAPSR